MNFSEMKTRLWAEAAIGTDEEHGFRLRDWSLGIETKVKSLGSAG